MRSLFLGQVNDRCLVPCIFVLWQKSRRQHQPTSSLTPNLKENRVRCLTWRWSCRSMAIPLHVYNLYSDCHWRKMLKNRHRNSQKMICAADPLRTTAQFGSQPQNEIGTSRSQKALRGSPAHAQWWCQSWLRGCQVDRKLWKTQIISKFSP